MAIVKLYNPMNISSLVSLKLKLDILTIVFIKTIDKLENDRNIE
jgi:hypothetical protein